MTNEPTYRGIFDEMQDARKHRIVRPGAAHAGLTWHFCRPPLADLDYEMDCRAVAQERVVAADPG